MALPNNPTPIYTLTIPSTGKEFKYRPFFVKEEKALMIAKETNNPVVMLDTLKQVIDSCSKVPVDLETFASFDIEYIFTQIRAMSVGEIVDLYFKCDTCTDEKAVARVQLDLTTLKVESFEGHTNKIDLFADVGVIMRYPTVETLKSIEQSEGTNLDLLFNVVVDCIEVIYDAEEVYHTKEQSKEELLAFINNLTSVQFAKIQNFFKTMPSLRAYISYECPVCKKQHNKFMEGLSSFF